MVSVSASEHVLQFVFGFQMMTNVLIKVSVIDRGTDQQ